MKPSRATAKPSNPLRIAALAALATMGLAACVGGTGPSGLTLTKGIPRAVIGDYTLGGPAQSGAGDGKLLVAEGGCFRLDSGGGQKYLLVFPQGTEILTEGQPGVQLDGKRYLVGSETTFGGGYRKLTSAERHSAAACQPDGEVFFIQALAGS